MRARYWERTVMGVLAVLLFSASSVAAQGWIEPRILRGAFSVDKTRSDVRIRVEGRVAVVEVSEWFRNDGDAAAEGDYLYPLPGEAVFQGFSLFQGDARPRRAPHEHRIGTSTVTERRWYVRRGIRSRATPSRPRLAAQRTWRSAADPPGW